MPFHAQLPLWDEKSDAQKLDTLKAMLDDLYGYALASARDNLRLILTTAIPSDEEEAQDIATMLKLLGEHPNITAQNCEVGHFTGSALVADNRGRILLHYHKNLHRWMQFGGHADYETDFSKVALREASEETGLSDLRHFPSVDNPLPIDFDVHEIPSVKNRPAHLHLDLRYLMLTEQAEKLNPPSDESQQLKWASPQTWLNSTEAKNFEPALIRLIQKAEKILEKHL